MAGLLLDTAEVKAEVGTDQDHEVGLDTVTEDDDIPDPDRTVRTEGGTDGDRADLGVDPRPTAAGQGADHHHTAGGQEVVALGEDGAQGHMIVVAGDVVLGQGVEAREDDDGQSHVIVTQEVKVENIGLPDLDRGRVTAIQDHVLPVWLLQKDKNMEEQKEVMKWSLKANLVLVKK